MNADDPSTHRMSADEVRALIRQLEPPPPPAAHRSRTEPHAEVRAEPTAEREPPTLLYRRATRAMAHAREPRTLIGLGVRELLRTKPRAQAGANQVSLEAPCAGAQHIAPTYTSARALDPAGNHQVADDTSARPRGSAHTPAHLWRRRSRLVVASIVMLIATAPLLMRLVADPTRLSQAREPARVDAADDTTAVPARRSSARSFARAPENSVAQDADGATQQRMDDVRRATELMVMGDSAGALSAFRVLSRGWPEHLALAHVVRVLEQRLRACAAQGGAACR